MDISFLFRIAPTGFSGGRYHMLMMAEALAAGGHHVTIHTIGPSAMFEMLDTCPAHDAITYRVEDTSKSLEFSVIPDVCVLAPDMGSDRFFYENWILAKVQHGAALVFVNFETPNWYNSLSPVQRDPGLWRLWDEFAPEADLILSIAKEGQKYAEEYYKSGERNLRQDFCYPAIQDHVIDSIEDIPQEKQFLTFARFNWSEHKGVKDLGEVMDERFRGYCLKVVCGQTPPPEDLRQVYVDKANLVGMRVEFLDCLDERGKYLEIKRSAAVLFPSYFEGFGYPPIESVYCGVPCVCFRLPVLLETAGEFLIFSEPGDWGGFRDGIAQAISTRSVVSAEARKRALKVSGFRNAVKNNSIIFRSLNPNLWMRLKQKFFG